MNSKWTTPFSITSIMMFRMYLHWASDQLTNLLFLQNVINIHGKGLIGLLTNYAVPYVTFSSNFQFTTQMKVRNISGWRSLSSTKTGKFKLNTYFVLLSFVQFTMNVNQKSSDVVMDSACHLIVYVMVTMIVTIIVTNQHQCVFTVNINLLANK